MKTAAAHSRTKSAPLGRDLRMSAEMFDAALRRHGFSESSFARYLGVNDRSVRRWSDGSIKVPPYVIRIFELLG